jgi:hypothetical protein
VEDQSSVVVDGMIFDWHRQTRVLCLHDCMNRTHLDVVNLQLLCTQIVRREDGSFFFAEHQCGSRSIYWAKP